MGFYGFFYLPWTPRPSHSKVQRTYGKGDGITEKWFNCGTQTRNVCLCGATKGNGIKFLSDVVGLRAKVVSEMWKYGDLVRVLGGPVFFSFFSCIHMSLLLLLLLLLPTMLLLALRCLLQLLLLRACA